MTQAEASQKEPSGLPGEKVLSCNSATVILGAVCAGTRTHLSQVLVVVGVGISAELGAVDDVAEQAHVLGQLNLGRLVG